MKKYLVLIVWVLGGAAGLQAEEEEPIVFSTAPTHSTEETVRLYRPLMSYLSEVTGRQFVIDPADNFIQYSIRMRLEKYDMLFDGPHLVGWRMEHTGHTPVARLPGTIRIVVAAREESKLQGMAELEEGQARVCAFTSPNMLTMAFLSYFPHPARQPLLVRTQGFKQLEQCLRSGRGEAAVLRDKLWQKMDQQGLRLIAEPPRGYPERTFTLSNRLGEPLRQKVAQALLSEEGIKVAQGILQRFKKETLLKAEPADYAGLGNLLNTVWGFHSR
jgi:ABC-type phosphate/phosphonate transport system substrate-binding protein